MTAQQEFIEAEGFSQDPLDEQQKNAVPNILHKYQKSLAIHGKRGLCSQLSLLLSSSFSL